MHTITLNGFQLLQLLGEVDHAADKCVVIQQPVLSPHGDSPTQHTLFHKGDSKHWVYLPPTGAALRDFVAANTKQPEALVAVAKPVSELLHARHTPDMDRGEPTPWNSGYDTA